MHPKTRLFHQVVVYALALTFSSNLAMAEVTLLERGSKTEWRYLDDGSDQEKDWSATDFDDSKWSKGKAPLGYGEDDQETELSFGDDKDEKHITTYFRTTFEVSEGQKEKIETLSLSIRRDDGAVVYLNGKEIVRTNMPRGSIEFDTLASSALPTGPESNYFDFKIGADQLAKDGSNVLAVEVHQASPRSSDLFLDLGIIGYAKGEGPKRDFYRDGLTAARNGDYETAAELLKQLPDDHENYAETMALLGYQIYAQALGRAEDGIPFVKKAYEKMPEDRRTLRAYLKTLILSGTLWDDKDIARERSTEIADEHKFLVTMPGIDSDPSRKIPREKLEADLDYLEHILTNCFAYLELRPIDYKAALDAIRVSLKDEMPVNSFELSVAKLISLFCDGHAGVGNHQSQYMLPGYAPFLASADGDRVFLHDGEDFLDEDHPYVTAIDGKPIAEWLKVAGYTEVKESPQWNRRQSIGNLRYINHLRAELELVRAPFITLSLESEDGKDKVEKEVDLSRRLKRSMQFPKGDHRRIGDVGYLRIPSMVSSPRYLAELEAKMKDFEDTEGLIIDLRGNSGGTKSILFTLFPYFMKPDAPMKVVELSTYRLPVKLPAPPPQGFMQSDMSAQPVTSKRWTTDAQREQVKKFIAGFEPEWKLPMEKFSMWHVLALDASINPEAYYYDKPLIILHDAGTFSAGDIFLGAFEGHPNTTLMGEASGGGNGWMDRYILPNSGISVTLCQSAKFRPNGKPYDGVGVAPDVKMLPKPADILGESDTVLDAALTRLKKK